jgi:hypothetical protein
MSKVDSKIEVNVPVSTAYNQWTQFEEFPRFMESIETVEQLSDERLHWIADLGGERKEWYARISRQVPDEVIAWESEGGVTNNGTIIFHSLAPDRTEVELHLAYDPADFAERIGGAIGFVSGRVEGDLRRFKKFIESRGEETGSWRGEIVHGAPADAKSQLHAKPSVRDQGSDVSRDSAIASRSSESSSVRTEQHQPTESSARRAERHEPPTPIESPLKTHDTGEAERGTSDESTDPERDGPPTLPLI